MTRSNILWGMFLSLGLLAMSCSSTRYYTSSEYDDLYYSSEDQADLNSPSLNTNQQVSESRYDDQRASGAPVYTAPNSQTRSYNDAYYAEDDFHFSRRVRRFNNTNTGFRYYDPYFTNDLYYVIGTPSWNQWNNRGWHNWNQPRFGVSWGYNPGWSPTIYQGFYNPYAYNPWNTVNYYNPWVDSYYGYSPWAGSAGFGGFGRNNRGFNQFGGGGFGGGYAYCPPSYYRGGAFGNNSNINSNPSGSYTRYRQAHRSSPATVSSRPGTEARTYDPRGRVKTRTSSTTPTRTGAPVNTTRNSTATSTRTRTGTDYLRPASQTTTQTRTSRNATNTSTQTPSRNTGRTSPRVYTAPSRTPSTTTQTRTSTPSRATTPSRTRTATPQRTPSRSNNVRQQRSTPTRTVRPSSTPSRSTRVSPNRSTPSRTRTVTPSRSSSRSRSSGGRSSSTPTRRN